MDLFKALLQSPWHDPANPVAIATSDSGRHLRTCNPFFEAMFGVPHDSLPGQSPRILYASRAEFEQQAPLYADHLPKVKEIRFVRRRMPFLVTFGALPIVGQDGSVLGLVAFMQESPSNRQLKMKRQRQLEVQLLQLQGLQRIGPPDLGWNIRNGLLTPREQEVLRTLPRSPGSATDLRSYQEAGEILGISGGCVKKHVANIKPKLGARNAFHAVEIFLGIAPGGVAAAW